MQKNIGEIQGENLKTFNKNRKVETKYEINELVAIKLIQFYSGLNLKPKFLGPYKVNKVLLNRGYEMQKVADYEGPGQTISVSEYTKKWVPSVHPKSSFGPNEPSGGSNVGREQEAKKVLTEVFIITSLTNFPNLKILL